MYRAAALRALRLGVPPDDHRGLVRAARGGTIELEDRGMGRILLDGVDVTEAIRSPETSEAASRMSMISGVRRALVSQQRTIGCSGDSVVEGRDIGTVVFPYAELKIFITASPEERARRRLKELREQGVDDSFDDVFADILERDRRDSTRRDSPLRRANDAVVLDTTDMGIDEQVEEVVRLAIERGATARKTP
jgi:cytidylate kinase